MLIPGLLLLAAGAQSQRKKGFDPDSTFADLSLDKAGANSALKAGETPEEKITDNILIKGSVSRNTCYAGESVRLQYRLFSALENTSQVSALPAVFGCNITEIPVSNTQVVRQTIEGKEYRVMNLWSANLATLQEGMFTISPLATNNQVRYRTESGGRSEYAGPAYSNAVTLRVLPLPPGKPSDFSGLIGTFHLSVAAASVRILQGTADSLRITISGTGNLSSYTGTPIVRWPSGMDTFTARQRAPLSEGSEASDYIDISFVPHIAGRVVLPPVSLSYFDPRAAAYKTVRSDSIVLNVLSSPVSPVASKAVAPDRRIPYGIGLSALLLAVGFGVWMYQRRAAARQAPAVPDPVPETSVAPSVQDALLAELAALTSLEDAAAFFPSLKRWLEGCRAQAGPETALAPEIDSLWNDCELYQFSGAATDKSLPDLKARAHRLMTNLYTTI